MSAEHVLQRYHSTTLTSGTTCHHSGHMPPLVGHHLADCTQDSSTPEGHQWVEKQVEKAAPVIREEEGNNITSTSIQHKLRGSVINSA